MLNANSTCSDNANNNNNTIKIKRFHITPAKNDHSADECDENNTHNHHLLNKKLSNKNKYN